MPGLGSFFGNRSITFHTSNASRLTCANFTLVAGSVAGNVTTTAPLPPPFMGAGSVKFISVGAVVAGVMALFL